MSQHGYAAFLRGMNLGNRRISNQDLCAAFAGLGVARPTAFLASGNVVFAAGSGDAGGADELARRLESGLADALGYAVPVFLRTAREVRAIADHRPFDEATIADSAGKLQVALLASAPEARAREATLALGSPQDRLAFAGRELYWLPAGRMSDSQLDWKAVERAVGRTTLRTRQTIERLATKFF